MRISEENITASSGLVISKGEEKYEQFGNALVFSGVV